MAVAYQWKEIGHARRIGSQHRNKQTRPGPGPGPEWEALDSRTQPEGSVERGCSFKDNNARLDLFAIWLKQIHGSRGMSPVCVVHISLSISVGGPTPMDQMLLLMPLNWLPAHPLLSQHQSWERCVRLSEANEAEEITPSPSWLTGHLSYASQGWLTVPFRPRAWNMGIRVIRGGCTSLP